MPRIATFAAIQRYVLSCGLLLVPASIWNIALTERLPSSFAPAEFWRDIPAPLALAENSLRVAVFVLPFFMPLNLAAPGRMRALFIFVVEVIWSTSQAGLCSVCFRPRRGQRVL